MVEWESNDRTFDSVNIRYLNFDNVKSVIFTKLESNTSQKGNNITCKVDTESDNNLMPFKVFKILFLKSAMTKLCTTKNNSVALKTCNQSDTEQLGMWTVKLRYKDESA